MRFNPDIAREILIEMEKAPPNRQADIDLPHVSTDEMIEYIELLNEAGLIEAKLMQGRLDSARIYRATLIRLTYEGHQFLEAARNDSLWERAKSHVQKSGGAMTLSIMKALLIDYARRSVGLGELPSAL